MEAFVITRGELYLCVLITLWFCGQRPALAGQIPDAWRAAVTVSGGPCPDPAMPPCLRVDGTADWDKSVSVTGIFTEPNTGHNFSGFGETLAGYFSGKLSLGKGSKPGGPFGIVVAQREAHFENFDTTAFRNRHMLERIDLHGTVTPPIPSPTVGWAWGMVTYSVYQNLKGTDWHQYKSGTAPCEIPVPDFCLAYTHSMAHFGDYTNTDPDAVPLFTKDSQGGSIENTPLLWGSHDYTIVVEFRIDANIQSNSAPSNVELEFRNTVHLYVDSLVAGYSVKSEDGHDYSDPDRRKTEIIVKSSAPTIGLGGGLSADPSYKIVGGGAQLQSGSDHLLVASHPVPTSPPSGSPPSTWSPNWLVGDLRSSLAPAPSAATAYSLQLKDPNSRYQIVVTQATSKEWVSPRGPKSVSQMKQRERDVKGSRPSARADVPAGFTLASGGCKLNEPTSQLRDRVSKLSKSQKKALSLEPKVFLVASYPLATLDPSGAHVWVCEAQQQQQSYGAGVVTAYAVGIKDVVNNIAPPMRIVKVTSAAGSQPATAAALLAGGFAISGCGARVERAPGAGNQPDRQLLTAMFPNTTSANGAATECQAKASDYGASAPGAVSAYAINLLLDRAMLSAVHPVEGKVGATARLTLDGTRFSPDMKVQFDNGSAPPILFSLAPTLYFSAHKAWVDVPLSFSTGTYQLNVIQGDVPGTTDHPMIFTVTP